MNLPRFPIHSLTVLALGVFVYLLVAIVFFNRVMATPEQQNAAGLMTAVKVTLFARENFTARTTSAASEQRAIKPGCLSMLAFQIRRAES
jgi:uncharacterized membrane protein (DUF485 family)